MIRNIKMNIKYKIFYQLMAEAFARADGLYNAQLTFINVANSN